MIQLVKGVPPVSFRAAVITGVVILLGTAFLRGYVVKHMDASNAETAIVRQEIAQQEGEKHRLKQELLDLTKPPKTIYDEAISYMLSTTAQDTDEADRSAIARPQAVTDHYPDTEFGSKATRYVTTLDNRINERSAQRAKAQAGLIALIKSCHDDYIMVRKVGASFSMYNSANRIDWNSYSASKSATSLYQREGDNAQAAAKALLSTVPDPDGTLAKRVENWAMPDDSE